MDRETVFVGLSGGVDSSVAALRLKQRGYNVVGVFIKVWQPDFLECNWEQERLDAMRVAAHLDIPFMTHDAALDYKREVAEYMIESYREGRTPNPDVMCNQHIKFGSFLKFAKKHGAQKIATGHYARKHTSEDGHHHILRGVDSAKDQSYFLWTLTQAQLIDVLFPIGDSKKDVVREEAKRAGLPVFEKKDSQGICFLGHVDIEEFLSHYIELVPGDVLSEDGQVIGRHNGALLYTIGQRHGFGVDVSDDHRGAHYVVAKDVTQNTITVSESPLHIKKDKTIVLGNINLIEQALPRSLSAQCRYRQKPFNISISEITAERIYITTEDSHVEYPSQGQSCVLYDGEVCVGGGIIL